MEASFNQARFLHEIYEMRTSKEKLYQCLICCQSFSRRDVILRHKRNVRGNEECNEPSPQSEENKTTTFQRPYSLVIPGPSGSGKTKWA